MKTYEKVKKEKKEKIGWYRVIPIAFFISVVPLIVYCKVIQLKGASNAFWTASNVYIDFFSYNKMVWIIVSAIVSAALFLNLLYSNKIKIKKIWFYIPLSGYSFFVILSTLFSKYKDVALFGFNDRYEGMFVILSYVIVCFIVINIIDNERHIKIIVYSLLISAFVIGIIGMFQYLNMDIFQAAFVKRLVLNSQYKNLIHSLDFMLGPRTVYGTLYHYDYMGSYMAMLFPLTLVHFLYTGRRKLKIIFGGLSLLMAFNLFACKSRAGVVGAIFAIIILLILSGKYLIKHYKVFIASAVGISLIFAGANYVEKGSIVNRLKSIFSGIEKTDSLRTTYGIKDLVVKSDSINIIGENGDLIIKINGDRLLFTDENGKTLDFNNNNSITFKDKRYSRYALMIEKQGNLSVLVVQVENDKMYFAVTTEGFKNMAGNGLIVDPKPIEKWGFEGREKMGSARAYIWSRSLPLLKNAFITGFGPDTFAVYFPQYDYIGKLKAYDTTDMLVDKPHDFYLQNAINTGIFSLISLLVLFIGYFVQSIKVYSNNRIENMYSITGLGVFIAICGYLVAGFFNDSVVSVAPVFWVLLGIGISINLKLAASVIKKEEVKANRK